MGSTTKILFIAVTGLVYILFHLQLIQNHSAPNYVLARDAENSTDAMFEHYWVSSQETLEAHSANIAISAAKPITVWYGGTEEGHRDVALFFAEFNGTWSAPRAFVDRASTQQGLDRHIRKIGNPALHVWPDGAIGVFYVSVSIGGWGASAINYVESRDQGQSWSEPERLVTSPFLNISTLVRTAPLQLSDGSIELPVYHEFIGKFSESLHVARDLTVLGKRRISWGSDSLQPAIAPITRSRSVALMRYAGKPPGNVWQVASEDSGATWSSPASLRLPNPNSAVAVLNTRDGYLLLALNDTKDDRNRLSLARRQTSDDAWVVIKVIEEMENLDDEEFEFSYPSLAMEDNGTIHLVYTWNQRRIRHVRFNRAWLNRRVNAP